MNGLIRHRETVLVERLREHLGKELFQHSLGVAETAAALARHWGTDPDRARLAGLVHDYARGFSSGELAALFIELNLPPDPVIEAEPKLLHAPVGAALLPADLDVTDPVVLEAVRWHTTGHAGMCLLEKVVYLADCIEPHRRYTGVTELRQAAWNSLEQALLMAVNRTIHSVLSRGMLLHPRSVEFRNCLIRAGRQNGGDGPE